MRVAAAIALVVSVAAVPSCGSGSHVRRRDPAVASQAPAPSARARASGSESESERESESESERASTSATASATASATDDWAHAPALETLEGRVSFYADSLAGHRTANGESYDPHALTCASRDLPFGTLIRVVRPDTGAFVVVRVNDRGPWGRTRPRILDLSRAAAEAIDMIRAGVITVRAEIVRRGP